MDKQMIEEMAKDLHKTHAVSAICSGKDCNHCKHATLKRFDDYTCIDLDLAESLFNAGYRKIPQNAVVLTEERNKIICDRFEQLERVQVELQELNAKYYNEAKDLRRELKRVRKETAEKFAERLKEKLNEWLEDNEDLDGKINFGIAQIELIGVKSLDGEIIAESLIEEICKEITDKEVQNGN